MADSFITMTGTKVRVLTGMGAGDATQQVISVADAAGNILPLAQDGADIASPTQMPAGGAGIRGWLSAIWTKLNGTLAVTGNFYPATQPVSGTVAVAGTVPVSGAFFQATQPVSLATNTPDVTDRAARLLGHVTVDNPSLTVATGLSQPLTDAQLRAAVVGVNSNAQQRATYLLTSAVSTGLLTAATAKTVLSLHHTVTATKTVRVRRIQVGVVATTAVAGNVTLTVSRGVAVPSVLGGAVIPTPTNPGTAAAEVIAGSNPTISAATPLISYVLGAVAASGAVPQVTVYDWLDSGEQIPLTLRAGSLDTLAINVTSTAGQTLTPYLTLTLTEE